MKMDQEKMSSPKKSQCGKMALPVTAVLVLCTLFSSIAMVMSILTFYNQSLTGGTDESVIIVEDDPMWEQETLSELERLLERDGLMKFSDHHYDSMQPPVAPESVRVQREDRESQLNDMCNSTKFSNYSDYLPFAHIVPNIQEGLQVNQIGEGLHRAPYVVITKNWRCSSVKQSNGKKDNKFGVMSGGMIFNRSSGFLTLPKDGVYYVYSHVQFRLQDTNKTYETVARIAVCIPGETCNMNPYNYPSLTESGGTVTQHNHKRKPGDGENGVYQGGLFHFPAGTRILILAKDPQVGLSRNEREQTDDLFISAAREESYMGAYLVQEMEYVH